MVLGVKSSNTIYATIGVGSRLPAREVDAAVSSNIENLVNALVQLVDAWVSEANHAS